MKKVTKKITKRSSQRKQSEEPSLPQALMVVSAIGERIMPEPYSSAFSLSRQIGEKDPQAGAWISGITLGILFFDSVGKSNHTAALHDQSRSTGQVKIYELNKTRL